MFKRVRKHPIFKGENQLNWKYQGKVLFPISRSAHRKRPKIRTREKKTRLQKNIFLEIFSQCFLLFKFSISQSKVKLLKYSVENIFINYLLKIYNILEPYSIFIHETWEQETSLLKLILWSLRAYFLSIA